ncbi:hypothetical protein KM043_002958 [Ampulex compressa]|nr:hypothetical protein KM043_002958 [Ampulex compressa]
MFSKRCAIPSPPPRTEETHRRSTTKDSFAKPPYHLTRPVLPFGLGITARHGQWWKFETNAYGHIGGQMREPRRSAPRTFRVDVAGKINISRKDNPPARSTLKSPALWKKRKEKMAQNGGRRVEGPRLLNSCVAPTGGDKEPGGHYLLEGAKNVIRRLSGRKIENPQGGKLEYD